MVPPARRHWLLAGQCRRRRYPPLHGRKPQNELATFFTLRQQLSKRGDRPNVALSDFVAPVESGKQDYVGGFVVTAGIEEVAIAERFERANDDYSSIMVKALADRFAEAFAERMHERVRREYWGYAPDEDFSNAELIGEPYGGIRPRPAIRRSRTIPKSALCSTCWMQKKPLVWS